ncbi:uncharacterized protein LOC114278589 [Camellia sinensis]|uniref:uncharacterized protein LOC114278589 n=1 Tax=Camellia sinensis TaxID=4442 RepID=UPI00103592BD|nr:uncharacterized protein LOC114278589 [Camellia sinensis]
MGPQFRLLLLFKFDLKYVTLKAIKGKVVEEFLANHPIKEDEAMEYLFPDENILQMEEETWMMYFDRASNQYGYGIGVLLMAPDDSHIPLAFKLQFKASNNETEYQACIAHLEAALELGVIRLDVIEDSNLVVSQENGDRRVKENKMKAYHQTLDLLISRFEKLTFTHLLRENNRFFDVVPTLSSMVDIPLGVCRHPIFDRP